MKPYPIPGPSALRRMVARLRAGAIVPIDPAVTPLELADAIERAMEHEQLFPSLAVRSVRSSTPCHDSGTSF